MIGVIQLNIGSVCRIGPIFLVERQQIILLRKLCRERKTLHIQFSQSIQHAFLKAYIVVSSKKSFNLNFMAG